MVLRDTLRPRVGQGTTRGLGSRGRHTIYRLFTGSMGKGRNFFYTFRVRNFSFNGISNTTNGVINGTLGVFYTMTRPGDFGVHLKTINGRLNAQGDIPTLTGQHTMYVTGTLGSTFGSLGIILLTSGGKGRHLPQILVWGSCSMVFICYFTRGQVLFRTITGYHMVTIRVGVVTPGTLGVLGQDIFRRGFTIFFFCVRGFTMYHTTPETILLTLPTGNLTTIGNGQRTRTTGLTWGRVFIFTAGFRLCVFLHILLVGL